MAPRKRIKPNNIDGLINEDPFLKNNDPVDPTIDPTKEPIGAKVYVTLPRFSRKLREMMREQWKNKETDVGTVRLPNGLIMEFGKTYLVELTPEIKKLLLDGVLMGGGRSH